MQVNDLNDKVNESGIDAADVSVDQLGNSRLDNSFPGSFRGGKYWYSQCGKGDGRCCKKSFCL